MELDILAEEISGNLINVELQMYKETAPFKRTRYYFSSIDMSILEKGRSYYELPDVTLVYITQEDFIGGKRGHYDRNITTFKVQKEGVSSISKETNSEILSKWHKYAAKASSFAEFEAKM